MARRYVFADESGNFDFSFGIGASRFFVLVTVSVSDCAVGDTLLTLRRNLAWEGIGLDREFHATTDAQAVRDRVFAALVPCEFRVDATIIEKAKTAPALRRTDEQFYQHAWWLHMQRVAPQLASVTDELLVVGASLGTKRRRMLFHEAVNDVIQELSPTAKFQVASWDAASDPCLQVADYAAWAIQRKWERSDSRSHVLIAPKLVTEVDIFADDETRYY